MLYKLILFLCYVLVLVGLYCAVKLLKHRQGWYRLFSVVLIVILFIVCVYQMSSLFF